MTPYNSSRLPREDEREGLQKMLEGEPTIHLTALSARTRFQRCWPPPARVPIDELRERTEAARTGNGFIDGAVDIRPEYALEPLDPLWCCAIDDRGKIAGRWRGRAAMEITR